MYWKSCMYSRIWKRIFFECIFFELPVNSFSVIVTFSHTSTYFYFYLPDTLLRVSRYTVEIYTLHNPILVFYFYETLYLPLLAKLYSVDFHIIIDKSEIYEQSAYSSNRYSIFANWISHWVLSYILLLYMGILKTLSIIFQAYGNPILGQPSKHTLIKKFKFSFIFISPPHSMLYVFVPYFKTFNLFSYLIIRANKIIT